MATNIIALKKWNKLWITTLVALILQVSRGMCDITKDKEECANQLTGLATCLPYVGGQAKAPTPDCCTGLNQVLKDSRKCLCVLVKDRNDPSLGLNINSTLALSLPHTCKAPPQVSNITECVDLLHLPPNSPDAKVFTDFGKAQAPASSTSTPATASETPNKGASGSSANATSHGGKGMRGNLMVTNQIIYGAFFLCFASLFIF